MQKLIFLDRDGVINEDLPEGVTQKEQLKLIPRSAQAIAKLNQYGVKVIIITNQSVIGKNLISTEALAHIHAYLQDLLRQEGAHYDDLYYCPAHPKDINFDRKPYPGMLLKALKHYRINANQIYFIGDSLRDLEAAFRVGCRKVLVKTGKGQQTEAKGIPPHLMPEYIADDLYNAVTYLLNHAYAKSNKS